MFVLLRMICFRLAKRQQHYFTFTMNYAKNAGAKIVFLFILLVSSSIIACMRLLTFLLFYKKFSDEFSCI